MPDASSAGDATTVGVCWLPVPPEVIVVALYHLVLLWISRAVAGYLLVAIAGIVLVALGATYERRLCRALRRMS